MSAPINLEADLRDRLAAAEAELAALQASARAPTSVPDAAEIVREIRETAAQLETALAGDVAGARRLLADRLGPIVLGERDGGVWAQTRIGPAMLLAGGADSNRGCGGAIRALESAREAREIRISDAPVRRRRAA